MKVILLALAAATMLSTAASAHSVRCRYVTGHGEPHTIPAMARSSARAAWVREAERMGYDYVSWRRARHGSIDCQAAGRFDRQCTARGRICEGK